MEFLNENTPRTPVRCVLFDFDGTISTLRHGWESVMKPLMLEMISGGGKWDKALEDEVDAYIDESTGIQTIYQMKWLAERARQTNPDAPSDPWWYKEEYNRRLMVTVEKRAADVLEGRVPASEYLMDGAVEFLKALKKNNVKVYVASGTDHPDVVREAHSLGVDEYFTQIKGAPLGEEKCSKEAVIKSFISEEGLSGDDFAVVGDGKVEIRLGKEVGARALGTATNEDARHGVDEVKRVRLVKAGADAIVGDFTELNKILEFMGLEA